MKKLNKVMQACSNTNPKNPKTGLGPGLAGGYIFISFILFKCLLTFASGH